MNRDGRTTKDRLQTEHDGQPAGSDGQSGGGVGVAESFDVPFHHFAVTTETKAGQEQQVRDVLHRVDADFIVLARYMQVLSPEFVQAYPERIINIHHSFLPAVAFSCPTDMALSSRRAIIARGSSSPTAGVVIIVPGDYDYT